VAVSRNTLCFASLFIAEQTKRGVSRNGKITKRWNVSLISEIGILRAHTYYTKVKSHEISSAVLCPLYGPLSPLWPSAGLFSFYGSVFLLRLSVPSTALCSFYGPLFLLRPSVPSTALCHLYGPLSPLKLSVPSWALCPLYGPLSHLRPPVPSTAFYSLHGPLPLLWPYDSSIALDTSRSLYPLYGPLSLVWLSVPSMRHVFSHLFREIMLHETRFIETCHFAKQLNKRKGPSCFAKWRNAFRQKPWWCTWGTFVENYNRFYCVPTCWQP
jgi:hypothetical protein